MRDKSNGSHGTGALYCTAPKKAGNWRQKPQGKGGTAKTAAKAMKRATVRRAKNVAIKLNTATPVTTRRYTYAS